MLPNSDSDQLTAGPLSANYLRRKAFPSNPLLELASRSSCHYRQIGVKCEYMVFHAVFLEQGLIAPVWQKGLAFSFRMDVEVHCG